MKYLIVFCLVGLVLIIGGNYLDLQRNRITKREYDRRTRLTIILAFIAVAVIAYLRKKY